MKRILAIIAGFFAFLILVVLGAFLVMPRTDVVMIIQPLPLIGPHATKFGEIKSAINETASHFIDDTIYEFKSTWRTVTEFSFSERPQRVVIELEPIRTKRPAPAASPALAKEPAPQAPEPTSSQSNSNVAAMSADGVPKTPTTEVMAPSGSSSESQTPGTELNSAAKPAELQPLDASPVVPASEPESKEVAALSSEAKEVVAPKADIEDKVKKTEPSPPQATQAKMKTTSLKPPKKPPPPAPKIDAGGNEHKQGLTYYKGIGGVEKNFKTAAKWFRQSSLKGNAAAQYNLGIMAYLGQGEEQSYEQAATWFRQAAKQDHALAQYNLGFLFYEGKGVEKDDLQAFMWIDRAARLGDEKAIKARETLENILPKDILKGR